MASKVSHLRSAGPARVVSGSRLSGLFLSGALVCALPFGPVAADEGAVRFDTDLEGQVGFSTKTARVTTGQVTLTPNLEIQLSDNTRMVVSGRFRSDGEDQLEPGRPEQSTRSSYNRRVLIGDRSSLELRDAYLSTKLGAMFLKIGKQQTVWGKSDGIKVLDVINPQTFREFILEDFDDSRIGLWSVNAQIPLGDVTLEGIFIPDQTYHDVPEFGATFALTAPQFSPPVNGPFVVNEPDRPDQPLADADVGARISGLMGSWDFSLIYFYHYEDQFAFSVEDQGGTALVTPEYNRVNLVGGTLANAFGPVTVRAEVGYTTNRAYNVEPVNGVLAGDGIVESDALNYVIGIDWNAPANFFVSGQFFHNSVMDNDIDVVGRDEDQYLATVYARRRAWNDRFTGEIQWYGDLQEGDGMVRPKVSFEVDDTMTTGVRADLFYGASDGIFGQFNQADRVLAFIALGL